MLQFFFILSGNDRGSAEGSVFVSVVVLRLLITHERNPQFVFASPCFTTVDFRCAPPRRSWPRPLLDRPSTHDALEILKRHPAGEFSGPNPNRRRPSQLDQLGVSVPAPDRHGAYAKLWIAQGGLERWATHVAGIVAPLPENVVSLPRKRRRK